MNADKNEQGAADRADGMVRQRPHVVALQDLAEVWPAGVATIGLVPVLVWVPAKPARAHIEDAYEDPEGADDRTAAVRWLEGYLTAHPGVFSRQAKDDARKQAGISDRTLGRAANKLGVIVGDVGFPRQTTWTLPDDSRARTYCEGRKPEASRPRPPGARCSVCYSPA